MPSQPPSGHGVHYYEFAQTPAELGATQRTAAVRLVRASHRNVELWQFVERVKQRKPQWKIIEATGVVENGVMAPKLSWTTPTSPEDREQCNSIGGEVIQHLRIAAEYFIYNEVWRASGAQPSSNTYFPSYDDAGKWRRARGKAPLTDLEPDLLDELEALQPWTGRGWLADLRDLSNPDKHRQPLNLAPTIGAHVVLPNRPGEKTTALATFTLMVEIAGERRDFDNVVARILTGLVTLVNPRLVRDGVEPIQVSGGASNN